MDARNTRLSEALTTGNVLAKDCPSRPVLQHLTSRWGVIVLVALLHKPSQRFSEIRKLIGGISEKMLAQTLQNFERDGFVKRTVHPVLPPHVDYELTDLGRESAQLVSRLADFVEGHIQVVARHQLQYDKTRDTSWNSAK